MDTAVIDARNPVEVRDAALRVLNAHLGPDVTRAFMGQYEGHGNFTAERQDWPDESIDEIAERLKKIDAEQRARRGKITRDSF
jgi:hypothetical protein